MEAAWALRQPLHDAEDTDAYRLFDGRWEGAPGWTVDRYGSVALIQRFSGAVPSPGIVEAYAAHGLAVVLRDRAERQDAALVEGTWPDPDPNLPREGRFLVRESGLLFGVDLLHGTNTGLFLDGRPLRQWVREQASGRRLLNLFSYTSAFGVAALAGGALSVENVDLVPSALERGRLNCALNGHVVDSRSHLRSDVFECLRQARKRERRWGGVICDPPPVRTQGGKKGFDPLRDMRRVLKQSWEVVAPGGWMLAVSALPDEERFEALLPEAIWQPVERGFDFPGPRDQGVRGWVARRDRTDL